MNADHPEGPDGADADLFDESGDDLIDCPGCGADIYADSERCPGCGRWLSARDRLGDGPGARGARPLTKLVVLWIVLVLAFTGGGVATLFHYLLPR